MAVPVYSRRIFNAPAFSGGPTLMYTAPAGFVAVVASISVVWGDVTVSALDAWIQLGDLTKLVRVRRELPFDTDLGPGCDVFDGRWTLHAGDQLYAQTGAGTCDFFVSGYELSLP